MGDILRVLSNYIFQVMSEYRQSIRPYLKKEKLKIIKFNNNNFTLHWIAKNKTN